MLRRAEAARQFCRRDGLLLARCTGFVPRKLKLTRRQGLAVRITGLVVRRAMVATLLAFQSSMCRRHW
jgi:hypothetical protein